MKIKESAFKRIIILVFGIEIVVLLFCVVWTAYNSRVINKYNSRDKELSAFRGEITRLYVSHQPEMDHFAVFFLSDPQNRPELQKEEATCQWTEWLNTEGMTQAKHLTSDMVQLIRFLEEPHQLLHESVNEINEMIETGDNVNFNVARGVFLSITNMHWQTLETGVNDIISMTDRMTASNELNITRQQQLFNKFLLLSEIIMGLGFIVLLVFNKRILLNTKKMIRLSGKIKNEELVIRQNMTENREIGQLAE